MSSGGIIIQQRSVIRQATSDPSIANSLPEDYKQRHAEICAKSLHDWSDDEDNFMRQLFIVAKHC